MPEVGFFRELPDGEPGAESVFDALGQGDGAESENLARYLDGGAWLAITTSFADDVIEVGRRGVARRGVMTDGVWLWPGELGHHVRAYNLRLPAEFVAHARERRWEKAEVTIQQLAELEAESYTDAELAELERRDAAWGEP